LVVLIVNPDGANEEKQARIATASKLPTWKKIVSLRKKGNRVVCLRCSEEQSNPNGK